MLDVSPSGVSSPRRRGLGDSECVSSSLLLVRRGTPLAYPRLKNKNEKKNQI